MGQAARQTIVIGSSWSWPRPAGEPCPLPAVLYQDANSSHWYLEAAVMSWRPSGSLCRPRHAHIEKAMEEYEEEGRKKWRGPGGLDPWKSTSLSPGNSRSALM